MCPHDVDLGCFIGSHGAAHGPRERRYRHPGCVSVVAVCSCGPARPRRFTARLRCYVRLPPRRPVPALWIVLARSRSRTRRQGCGYAGMVRVGRRPMPSSCAGLGRCNLGRELWLQGDAQPFNNAPTSRVVATSSVSAFYGARTNMEQNHTCTSTGDWHDSAVGPRGGFLDSAERLWLAVCAGSTERPTLRCITEAVDVRDCDARNGSIYARPTPSHHSVSVAYASGLRRWTSRVQDESRKWSSRRLAGACSSALAGSVALPWRRCPQAHSTR